MPSLSLGWIKSEQRDVQTVLWFAWILSCAWCDCAVQVESAGYYFTTYGRHELWPDIIVDELAHRRRHKASKSGKEQTASNKEQIVSTAFTNSM